jgi:ribose 5-phosphate isomerase A
MAGGASRKDLKQGGVDDPAVQVVAEEALHLVQDGARIGLGSGRAATAFIRGLGAKVQQGLKVQGVPTSEASATLARQLGIPLIELAEDTVLDMTVDGADEVAPNLDLLKGWGGALVRERVVTCASKQQIVLVGAEKLVDRLATRGPIPVEIIPLALGYLLRELKARGLKPIVRHNRDGSVFKSDNGNLCLNCAAPHPLAADEARDLDMQIIMLAGVVDTGLFLGTATQVFVGYPDRHVETMRRGTA